jgi:hypothetical protein
MTDTPLVNDRDNVGVIDNGAELSMLAEDPKARTSLAALARLDSNGDKVIDATDARFAELKVWIDDNANGSTDAGELRTLGDAALAFHPSEPDPERAAALYSPNAPAPGPADAMAIVPAASILPDADIMAAASQFVTAISTYDVGGQIGELTRGLWQNMASEEMMIAASLDR